jgi:hypothetical protein
MCASLLILTAAVATEERRREPTKTAVVQADGEVREAIAADAWPAAVVEPSRAFDDHELHWRLFSHGFAPGHDMANIDGLLDGIDRSYCLSCCFEVGQCKMATVASLDRDQAAGGTLKLAGVHQPPLFGHDVHAIYGSSERAPCPGFPERACYAKSHDARRMLESGWTIQVTGLHFRDLRVAHLAERLESGTGMFVSANAYLSPSAEEVANGVGAEAAGDAAAETAFGEHYDSWDVHVLQLEGRKDWTLYAPLVPLPHPHQQMSISELLRSNGSVLTGGTAHIAAQKDKGHSSEAHGKVRSGQSGGKEGRGKEGGASAESAAAWEGGDAAASGASPSLSTNLTVVARLTLTPGEVLYLPRGIVHRVAPRAGERSLHISFGVGIFEPDGMLLTNEALLHYSVADVASMGPMSLAAGASGAAAPRPPRLVPVVINCRLPKRFGEALRRWDKPRKNVGKLFGGIERITWRSLIHLAVYANALATALTDAGTNAGILPTQMGQLSALSASYAGVGGGSTLSAWDEAVDMRRTLVPRDVRDMPRGSGSAPRPPTATAQHVEQSRVFRLLVERVAAGHRGAARALLVRAMASAAARESRSAGPGLSKDAVLHTWLSAAASTAIDSKNVDRGGGFCDMMDSDAGGEFEDLETAFEWALTTWSSFATYATAFEMFRAAHTAKLAARAQRLSDHTRRHGHAGAGVSKRAGGAARRAKGVR